VLVCCSRLGLKHNADQKVGSSTICYSFHGKIVVKYLDVATIDHIQYVKI